MDTIKEFLVINEMCLRIFHKLQLLVPSPLVGKGQGEGGQYTSNAPDKPARVQNPIRVEGFFEALH